MTTLDSAATTQPGASRTEAFGAGMAGARPGSPATGMGAYGLAKIREGLADSASASNNPAGAPTTGNGVGRPAISPQGGNRPIDVERQRLQAQSATSQQGSGQADRAKNLADSAEYQRVRAGERETKRSTPRAPLAPEQPPTMQPRQFGMSMGTAHHAMATSQALGRLSGPGGWKHLASFAMGEHLQTNSTPFGRRINTDNRAQAISQRDAAKAAAKVPKPPRISG